MNVGEKRLLEKFQSLLDAQCADKWLVSIRVLDCHTNFNFKGDIIGTFHRQDVNDLFDDYMGNIYD